MTDNDIWMEGEDDRECNDCGHTSHTCTCYEVECSQCNRVVDPSNARQWNGKWYCNDNCMDLFLNELK